MTRFGRQDVAGSVSATQPKIWTFLDFEAPDDRADEVAATLADALLPDDGWYADFTVAGDHVVVFAGRVFRYRLGDTAGRAQAVAYGLPRAPQSTNSTGVTDGPGGQRFRFASAMTNLFSTGRGVEPL